MGSRAGYETTLAKGSASGKSKRFHRCSRRGTHAKDKVDEFSESRSGITLICKHPVFDGGLERAFRVLYGLCGDEQEKAFVSFQYMNDQDRFGKIIHLPKSGTSWLISRSSLLAADRVLTFAAADVAFFFAPPALARGPAAVFEAPPPADFACFGALAFFALGMRGFFCFFAAPPGAM